MADDSPITTQVQLLSGDALYNTLMAKIEPDLTLDVIHTLDEKYANETDDERKKRAQRYEQAFEEYDRQYAEYQKQWNTTFSAYKREALRSVESGDRAQEASVLADLEEQMA